MPPGGIDAATLVRDGQDHPFSCAGVYQVVGLGCPFQGQQCSYRDCQGSIAGGGGEAGGGLLPGGLGGVVAAGEPDVVGESDLDDTVHAAGRQVPDDGGRIGLIQRDRMRDGRTRDLRQVGATPDRPDDRRSVPPGELRRQRPDSAQDTLDQDRQPADRTVGKNRAVRCDARDARDAPS